MRTIDADRLKKSFEANTPIAFQDCVPGIHSVIDLEPTVDAIPVEFIKHLYKKAIEYRDGFCKYSPAWDRANEQAIGLNSVLQVWGGL